jgi:hypothetical protein
MRIHSARERVEDFVEFAIPHEKTGAELVNAPHHVEWQQFLRENRLAVLIASVEHAKSQQVGVGATLHALGRDPSLRVAIVSNTQGQACKLLSSIRQHVETNRRVQAVFPNLKRSKRVGSTWHSTALEFQRSTIAKDPSLQALGVGSAILGSRLDGIIVDDVLDFENTRTAEQVQKTLEWFDSSVFNRLTDGGFCWVIGTPWMPDDLLATLSARPGWASRTYGAVRNPDDAPEKWVPLWPEQFSADRLRKVAANLTPGNFARSYLCRVRTDQMSRFQEAWIEQCIANGKGRTTLNRQPVMVNGTKLPCFTGVDLAVGKDAHNDLTVLFTIALEPGTQRRIVLECQSGRWQAPETLARITDVYRRYDSRILVEDNGAQSYLLQWATQQGLPVMPFTTGKNKYDEAFGVESLAVEMRAGLWVIPSGFSGQDVPEELRAWIRELLFYNPDGHTGDRCMASWFAREAARSFARGITAPHAATMR